MAYSDYGGYAYRDGVRVIERSDAIASAGNVRSTPGMWPGFELAEGRDGRSEHALLGDQPLLVGLYKQSTVRFYWHGRQIASGIWPDAPSGALWTNLEENTESLDHYYFRERSEPARFRVHGADVTIWWLEEDNFYQYAELRQADGVVWHGFSGYGVGAGLEDSGYGFSTEERERTLWCLFERPGA